MIEAKALALVNAARRQWGRIAPARQAGEAAPGWETLLRAESPGRAIGLAAALGAAYLAAGPPRRGELLARLAEDHSADPASIEAAMEYYRAHPGPRAAAALHRAAEPPRQAILRRLNAAKGGTALLVTMRKDALELLRGHPDFDALDADFDHLFASWFNAGFLRLRRLDWEAPGAVLSRLIAYEAVHAIGSWGELRDRLQPDDRRCYAFFHPQMADDPLIFVEVALTREIPTRIDTLLSPERTPLPAAAATHAVFYSISNCQEGLRGISFGELLIKQVTDALRAELPRLERFVTLSPVPGLAREVARLRADPDAPLGQSDRDTLALLDRPGWPDEPIAAGRLRPLLLRIAAGWLSDARAGDPVARFHLGNGARLERINWLANRSPRGMAESFGIMANYLYDPPTIERNRSARRAGAAAAASAQILRLARRERRPAVLSIGRSTGTE